MAARTKAEDTEVAIAKTVAPARKSIAVRAVGVVSELADQPQLISICAATLATGLFTRNRRLARAGARMLAAELLATKLKTMIKQRIDRTRPVVVAEGRSYQRQTGNDEAHEMNSFPSGHTAGAVAVARAFARDYPEHNVAAYIGAAGVGAIQIPRCTHYPSDIAAGALVGLLADGVVASVEKFISGMRRPDTLMSEHDGVDRPPAFLESARTSFAKK